MSNNPTHATTNSCGSCSFRSRSSGRGSPSPVSASFFRVPRAGVLVSHSSLRSSPAVLTAISLLVSASLVVSACSSTSDDEVGGPGESGGTTGGTAIETGGTGGGTSIGSGGISTGGVSTGGVSTGGSATGGRLGSGGAPAGGSMTGGRLGSGGVSASGGDGGSATGGQTASGGDGVGGSDSGGRTGAGGTSTGTPSAGCGKAPTLKSGQQSIQSGGQNRSFMLRLPETYDNNHPHRLIFAFHWNGGSMNDVDGGGTSGYTWSYYGLREQAENSTIFVAPQGNNAGWAN